MTDKGVVDVFTVSLLEKVIYVNTHTSIFTVLAFRTCIQSLITIANNIHKYNYNDDKTDKI